MLLAYDDDGPGPVVVLLHGFPLNRSMWSSQQARVGSEYRVIAPDLRGHGETAAPDGVYTIEAMADDVVELLDALQLTEPIVLGGLSMGGYVALDLVVRHPRRVRGLILIDTRAAADAPAAARNREDLARMVEESGSVEPVVEGMLPRLFSETTRLRRAEVIGPIRDAMLNTPPRAVAGALRGMAGRRDRTEDLHRIAVPALVLVGADDVITPPAEAQAMAALLPDAQLQVIADAGHLAPVENPEAVNEAMLRFLARLG
jgi:pimeloyl-ACP methyl ester carboxylesterase